MRPAPASPAVLPSHEANPLPQSHPSARTAGVGLVVLLANGGLLVLQLVAGRLLAPFVGSSLETWTAIIASFLTGIALGNAVGGRRADRAAGGRQLALFLAAGGVAALWMVGLPELLFATGLDQGIPLRVRIPVLAFAICFPPGFALSLLTPLAVKIGTPDVRQAGRAAGAVFALSAVGSLLGNYATGFYLIPSLMVNTIVFATAGLLFVAAVLTRLVIRDPETAAAHPPRPTPLNGSASHHRPAAAAAPPLPIRTAYAIVFLASFAGMTLELTASRLLAQILGVSLFTWTGIIGVMLAGTAAGNAVGGVWGDRAGRSGDPAAGLNRLASCLVAASFTTVFMLLVFFAGVHGDLFLGLGIIARVLGWTFVLFFLPMLMLGTVSPQVIRLAVPDVAHVGRVAGRVYAVSTAGAILGTLAAGFVLMSTMGMYRTILLAGFLPAVAAVLTGRVVDRTPLLYALSVGMGGAVGGLVLLSPENTKITRETNYYTITVWPEDKPLLRPVDGLTEPATAVAGAAGLFDPPGTVLQLKLDTLAHSWVKPTDPTYLKYTHERTQLELLRGVAAEEPAVQRVLVIGGGGYTFPRCARTLLPTAAVDVVEIDPGVTAISYSHLHLDPKLGIRSFHMDGRQFVTEAAPAGHYHLVTLDAVNDLTVPYHLLTREFNGQVKRSLAPKGVYLLTVIDILEDGQLWRAAMHTLKQTFPHVALLTAHADHDPGEQQVYVIYAANEPLDLAKLRATLAGQGVADPITHAVDLAGHGLDVGDRPVLLTDQFAPVDNMMADVFRRRKAKQ